MHRMLLLCVATVIAAAGIGASLGNGSLVRAFDRLRASVSEPAPVSVAMAATPARSGEGAVRSTPRATSTPTVGDVPVMRFQDLPRAANTRERSGLASREPAQ
jgi:hypothetical protein